MKLRSNRKVVVREEDTTDSNLRLHQQVCGGTTTSTFSPQSGSSTVIHILYIVLTSILGGVDRNFLADEIIMVNESDLVRLCVFCIVCFLQEFCVFASFPLAVFFVGFFPLWINLGVVFLLTWWHCVNLTLILNKTSHNFQTAVFPYNWYCEVKDTFKRTQNLTLQNAVFRELNVSQKPVNCKFKDTFKGTQNLTLQNAVFRDIL